MNPASHPPVPFLPRLREIPADLRGASRFPVTNTLALLRTTCGLSEDEARQLATTRAPFAHPTAPAPATPLSRGRSWRFELTMVALTLLVLAGVTVLIVLR